MAEATRGRRVWLACVVVSLLAHATVTVVLVRMPVSVAPATPLAVDRGHEDVRVRPMMIFPADEAGVRNEPPERDVAGAVPEVPPPTSVPDRPMAHEELQREELPQQVVEPLMVAALGVEGGLVDAQSWLKSVTEGEHGAAMSRVEQPRLDRDATPAPQGPTGDGGDRGVASGAPDAATATTPAEVPANIAAPALAASAEQRAREEREAQAEQAAQAARIAQTKLEAVAPSGTSGGERPKEPSRRAQELVTAQPEVKAQQAVDAQRAQEAVATSGGAAAPGSTSATPSSAAPGSPGAPSARQTVAADRDSDAFTLKRSAVFRNGRVDAGEGLEIRTVRPEFSLLTRAIVPRSPPTVEITFAKTGRVRSVRLVQSSGYKVELDDPVIAAAYNWRASGKALRELPDRPEAGVKLTVVMLIN